MASIDLIFKVWLIQIPNKVLYKTNLTTIVKYEDNLRFLAFFINIQLI